MTKGWTWKTLENIVSTDKNAIRRGPFGSAIKKAYFVKSGYKIYEQKHAIRNDFFIGNYYINSEKFQELKNFELKPGDIIISCSGTIGKIAIAPNNIEKGIINQALLKITLDRTKMLNKYFFFLFQSYILKDESLQNLRGTAIKNIVSVKTLKSIKFPTPPLPEQKRIVNRIEILQKHSQKAKEALDEIPKLIEQFRQSVLAAAFRGDLTKDWRAKNLDVEPASALLERIRKERRERWEQQELQKMQAKGKTPKDDKWKQKYKEPQPVDTTGLPELPEGACKTWWGRRSYGQRNN